MALQLLELPLPVFQCVIEHTVKVVGLYKAQRLRLICKTFDAEVLRAVFATDIFDLGKFQRTKNISPECFYIHLCAKINNPRLHSLDTLSTAIRRASQYLLSQRNGVGSSAQQVDITNSLCLCIAYNFDAEYIYDARPFDLLSKQSEDNFIPTKDALAITAVLGDKTLLQDLFDKGFDPDVKSPVFGYPLQNAATLGNGETAKLILEQSIRRRQGASSCDALSAGLISASRMGQTAIALDILSAAPQPVQESLQLHKAVCIAARHGHVELLKLLLDLDSSSKPQLLGAALSNASVRGLTETMRFLLDNGADPNMNREGADCLYRVAFFGNTHALQLLLSRGARYFDSLTWNPLSAAVVRGHEEIAAILLKNGASLNRPGKRDSMYCVSAAKNGEVSMLRFLIQHGLNLSQCGDRSLEAAAEFGQEEMVRFLVSQGFSVNGKASSGRPMLKALMWSQYHIVDTLLKLGAAPVDPFQSEYAGAFYAGEYPSEKDF